MGSIALVLWGEEFEEILREFEIFLEEFKVRNLAKYTFPTSISPIVLCEEKYPYIYRRYIGLFSSLRQVGWRGKILTSSTLLSTQAYAPIRTRTHEGGVR